MRLRNVKRLIEYIQKSVDDIVPMQDTDESVDSTSKGACLNPDVGVFVKQRKNIEDETLRHQQSILPRNNGEPHSHLISTSGSVVVRTESVESQEAFQETNTAPHWSTIQIKM